MTAPLTGDDLGDRERSSDAHERRRPSILRGVRASFAFFTRLPVGGFPYDDRELAWAPAHAPLVGALAGAALGALGLLIQPLGAFAAAALVLGFSMLITGALHEDGLADTFDALGGGRDRSHVLAILKDSRVGSFGAAAIAVSILARTALLAQLGKSCAWALPLAWGGARVGPVWLMVFLPYVTPAQTTRSVRIVHPDWRRAVVASAWFLVTAAVAFSQSWIAMPRMAMAAAAMAAVASVTGLHYRRHLGGITGDFLGATEQLGEIAMLAIFAWPDR